MFKRNDLNKQTKTTTKHVTAANIMEFDGKNSHQAAMSSSVVVGKDAGTFSNSEMKIIPTKVNIQTNQQNVKITVPKDVRNTPKIKNNICKKQIVAGNIAKPCKNSNTKIPVFSPKTPVQLDSRSSNLSKRNSTLLIHKNSEEKLKSKLSFHINSKEKAEDKIVKTRKNYGNWKKLESQINIRKYNPFTNVLSKNSKFHKKCMEETDQPKKSTFKRATEKDIKLNSSDTSDGADGRNNFPTLTSSSVKKVKFADLSTDNLSESSRIIAADMQKSKDDVSNKFEHELKAKDEIGEIQKKLCEAFRINETENGNIEKESEAYLLYSELSSPSTSLTEQHLESSKLKTDEDYFEFVKNPTPETSPSKHVFSETKDFDGAQALPIESKQHKTFSECTTTFENTFSSSKEMPSIPRLKKVYLHDNYAKNYTNNSEKFINKEISEKFHEKAFSVCTKNSKVTCTVPEMSMEGYSGMLECPPEPSKKVSSIPKLNITVSPDKLDKLLLSVDKVCIDKECIDKNVPEISQTTKLISENRIDSGFSSTVPSEISIELKRQCAGYKIFLKSASNTSTKVSAVPKENISISPDKKKVEVFEIGSLKSINKNTPETLRDVKVISEEAVDFNANCTVPKVSTDCHRRFSEYGNILEHAPNASESLSSIHKMNLNKKGENEVEIQENDCLKSIIEETSETLQASNVTSENISYSKATNTAPAVSLLNSKECVKHPPTTFHSKIKLQHFQPVPKKESIGEEINDKIKFLTSKFLARITESQKNFSHKTGKRKGILSKYYDDQMAKALTFETNAKKDMFEDTALPRGQNFNELRKVLTDDMEELRKVFQTDTVTEDTKRHNSLNENDFKTPVLKFNSINKRSKHEDTPYPFGQNLNVSRNYLNDDMEEPEMTFQAGVNKQVKQGDSPFNKNNIRSPVYKFQSMNSRSTASRIPRFTNYPMTSQLTPASGTELEQCANESEKQLKNLLGNNLEKLDKMSLYYETPKRPRLVASSSESTYEGNNWLVEKELTHNVRYHEKHNKECLDTDNSNLSYFTPEVHKSTALRNEPKSSKYLDENNLPSQCCDPHCREYEQFKNSTSEQMNKEKALDEEKGVKKCLFLSKGFSYRAEKGAGQLSRNEKKKNYLNRKPVVRRDVAIYRKLAVSIFVILIVCGLLVKLCV